MKKIFTLLFSFCALSLNMRAQEQEQLYNLHVHLADGTSKVFHVEKIDSVTFHEAPNYSNLTFDIQISDIFSNGLTTTVSCNRPDVLFYNDVFEKAYLDKYTPEQIAQDQLEYMWADWEEREEQYKEAYGADMTFADFFCPGGYVDEYTYDYLKPEQDYIVLAFGVDLNLMEVVGTPVYKEFSTTSAVPSDNIISFSVRNDSLIISTTNNDPYFWNPFTAEDIIEYGATTATEAWELMVEEVDREGVLDWFISEGSQKFTIKSCFYQMPGTYTLVAAGWNGARTTDFFTFKLTVTPEQAGAGQYSISAKRLENAKKSASLEGIHRSRKVLLEKR